MVLQHGRRTEPRGYKTWEIEDATIVIENPRRLLPIGVGRGTRQAIGAAEALGLCAGLDVTTLCVSVSDAFSRFLDGSVLWGQYGRRVRGQMESVITRLRDDKDSRQAVVQIYDPAYDQLNVRDIPCTLGFGFRIRDGGLHMTARMRSQDAWLGLAYDAFFFGQLGWTVANLLDVELTRLCIKQDSLHVYERDVDKIGEQLHWWDGTALEEPRGFGYRVDDGSHFFCRLGYESFRVRAESVYNQETLECPTASESEQWYVDTLNSYSRLTRTQNFSS